MDENRNIIVQVIEASNLATRDPKDADPYCVVRFGKNEKKTKTVKHLCSPQWNEEFKIPIELGLISSTKLELIVLDKATSVVLIFFKKNKQFVQKTNFFFS